MHMEFFSKSLFFGWVLLYSWIVYSNSTGSTCSLPSENLQVYEKDGDIIFGGLVPVHSRSDNFKINFTEEPAPMKCENFYMLRYQEVLAMVYAINEINNNPDLLPNITLGFRIFDSCYNEANAVRGSMRILAGIQKAVPNYKCESHSKLVGLIGDLQSSSSMATARILGLYRFPQIGYASAFAGLSDKVQFPSFLRTIQSDRNIPSFVISLMNHFGWTWIGILASDNDFRLYDSELVRKDIESAGICVAFFIRISSIHSRAQTLSIINTIRKSTANVVFIYCEMPELIPFMQVATTEGITGKVWFATASWISTPIFSHKEFWKTLNGTIGVALPLIKIPGFRKFLYSIHPSLYPEDIFITSLWELGFGCLWPKEDHNRTITESPNQGSIPYCTGEENLEKLKDQGYNEERVRYAILIYNAVYSMAHGVSDMTSCKSSDSCFNISRLKPWELLHYIKRVRFNNTAGRQVFYNVDGDQTSQYLEYVNWQALPDGTTKYVSLSIANQRPKSVSISNNNTIFWSGDYTEVPVSVCSASCPPGYRKAPQKGQPVCCFDCILCSENEFNNETDSTKCMKCPDGMWPNERRDGCRHRSLEFLSYKDPLGGTLASLSIVGSLLPLSILVIFFRNSETPIIKANNRNLSYLLLFALCFCYLCSLLFIGHPFDITCILRQIIFGISFVLCISCILGKTMMVVIAFNSTQPKSSRRIWLNSRIPNTLVFVCTAIQVIICVCWVVLSPPFMNNDKTSNIGKIILECNDGSSAAFWCMLGYMGILATLSFAVAYLSRKLPGSFNEAKLITFSMLIFGAVWISFIPAYLSTRGKYMVAVEIFAMLSSSSGLLGCIFLPKCYIIILRPEMNNKEFLTRERKSNKNKLKY